MRCGRTFRSTRMHPARARSSGSGLLSRCRSLVGYTIDMHECEFSEPTSSFAGFRVGAPADNELAQYCAPQDESTDAHTFYCLILTARPSKRLFHLVFESP